VQLSLPAGKWSGEREWTQWASNNYSMTGWAGGGGGLWLYPVLHLGEKMEGGGGNV
jgi:hypothetical protein